jgi:uncharacterized protein
MSSQIHVSPDEVRRFCERWKIIELSLFGSVLREDFGHDSDVDVLVSFAAGAAWDVGDLMDMEEELADMFGRGVDLVERRLVEGNRNYIIRRHILSSAEPIYVAR